MTAQQLRAWLAEKLKDDDYLDWFWAFATEEHGDAILAALAITAPSERFAECSDVLAIARRSRRHYRSAQGLRPRPGRSRHGQVEPLLSEYEATRAWAISRYRAWQAAAHPAVRRFRQQVLGGRVLSPEEARAFLASPATAWLSQYEFERRQILFIGHSATIVQNEYGDDDEGQLCHQIAILIEPPGVTWAHMRYDLPRSLKETPTLAVVDENGREQRVTFNEHSVLADVHQLATKLVRHFPWAEAQATWFLLTGAVPLIDPLTLSWKWHSGWRNSYACMTLKVEPWVSADSVLKLYRDAQRKMLGRDNRPHELRNLTLLHFVIDHTAEDGTRPTWQALMTKWNREHPGWAYTDLRLFARDYARTELAIAVPHYHFT